MNIKILVATHKIYPMPEDTSVYLPVQVGCDEVEERFGYQCDNEGENISNRHKYYSDLSSLYWGWKNLKADYIGNCHYRRYFVSSKAKSKDKKDIFRNILSREELEMLLKQCSIIVAPKRNYYIETMKSHFEHIFNPKDLGIVRDVIEELYPDYLDNFDKVMNRTYAHIFNTFIMDRKNLDSFCQWMFDILFECEKRVDISSYTEYEARICGYISEFLLDTWLEKNNVPYQEVKLKLLEKTNWLVKGGNFLKRKIVGSRFK